jgi:hypothetical protein
MVLLDLDEDLEIEEIAKKWHLYIRNHQGQEIRLRSNEDGE